MLWFLGWILGPSVLAAVPPPLSVTAAEQEVLREGEIVVRDSGDGAVVGVVDLGAAPPVVLEEVMNLEARVAEVGPIQDITVYARDATGVGARWEVGMFGVSAVFHVRYTVDTESGWCTFSLDGTKENEIASTAGSYQVYASGTGTRLVYRSEASAEGSTPAWLRDFLTSRSMRQQLTGIAARAERRGLAE